MRSPIKVIVTLLLFFGGSAATAAQLVVVASDGSTLQPGTVIDGEKTLTLQSGSSVTLVAESGKAITLNGPYQGAPETGGNASSTGVVQSLSRLLNDGGQTNVMAAFRNVPGKKRLDPFAIDVSRSGIFCAQPPAKFHRKRASRADWLSLELVATHQQTQQIWPINENTLPWPKDVPLKDGANYSMRLGDSLSASDFTLRLLPETLPTDAHRAAWMAENGCERQARAVLRTLTD